MNFINPHAILLCKENSNVIHRTTGMSFDVINDLLTDAALEQKPFYIVGWRHERTGLPTCEVLTAEGLKEKYQLESIPAYADSGFRKL